jgi:hypothetical protein
MDAPAPRRFQIGLRTLLEVMAVVAVILALFYTRSPTASPSPGPPVGRYQMILRSDGDLMMFDTATGQSWRQHQNNITGDWFALPMPSGMKAD